MCLKATFFTVLEKVQATTNLFPHDMVDQDKCGIGQTLQQSVMAHARNMEIPIELLKAINCWRTEASSKMGAPCLDTPDVYTPLWHQFFQLHCNFRWDSNPWYSGHTRGMPGVSV
jgi:hypothetical protein